MYVEWFHQSVKKEENNYKKNTKKQTTISIQIKSNIKNWVDSDGLNYWVRVWLVVKHHLVMSDLSDQLVHSPFTAVSHVI